MPLNVYVYISYLSIYLSISMSDLYLYTLVRVSILTYARLYLHECINSYLSIYVNLFISIYCDILKQYSYSSCVCYICLFGSDSGSRFIIKTCCQYNRFFRTKQELDWYRRHHFITRVGGNVHTIFHSNDEGLYAAVNFCDEWAPSTTTPVENVCWPHEGICWKLTLFGLVRWDYIG